MVSYGQVVIGPPGSGKTTYCLKMKDHLSEAGRKCVIVNLDPANNLYQTEIGINICDLITIEDVANEYKLGPNGSLLYCMDFLLENIDWLVNGLKKLEDHYFIFDCPGQIELFCSNTSFSSIIHSLLKNDFRLLAVQLIEIQRCNDAGVYFSTLLETLISMLHLGMPQINLFSKVDLLKNCDLLKFPLEYYSEVQDLTKIIDCMKDDFRLCKYLTITEKLASLIEDHSLISFIPFTVNETFCLEDVSKEADKANGYVIGKCGEYEQNDPSSIIFTQETHMKRMEFIKSKFFIQTNNQDQ